MSTTLTETFPRQYYNLTERVKSGPTDNGESLAGYESGITAFTELLEYKFLSNIVYI